jgi:hypothetical protein
MPANMGLDLEKKITEMSGSLALRLRKVRPRITDSGEEWLAYLSILEGERDKLRDLRLSRRKKEVRSMSYLNMLHWMAASRLVQQQINYTLNVINMKRAVEPWLPKPIFYKQKVEDPLRAWHLDESPETPLPSWVYDYLRPGEKAYITLQREGPIVLVLSPDPERDGRNLWEVGP